MAILKIARMGHPVLRQRAEDVVDPTTPEVRRLVADMIETLIDAQGTGLAAPQVHIPLRLVIFHVPKADQAAERYKDAGLDDGDDEVGLTILINPTIEPVGDEVELGWEGCLSIPGFTGEVPRYRHIRYRGIGLDGAQIEREAIGFHARVVQHECDHLDGVLYPMRIADLSRYGFTEEMRQTVAAEHEAAMDAELDAESDE